LYKQLLEYIRQMYSGEYWFALPREIATYAERTLSPPCRPRPSVQPEEAQANGTKVISKPIKPEGVTADNRWRLRGKRAAVLLFSYYPADPRPRRAAEALAMEGVTVDLICLQSKQEEPRREIVNGVNIFR